MDGMGPEANGAVGFIMKLTSSEKAMIRKMATSKYNDIEGQIPECADETRVEPEYIIETKADKRIFNQLVKKELAEYKGWNTINLSEGGVMVYLAMLRGVSYERACQP